MGLTQVKTTGIADDAVTTDKLANAINTERTANTAKATNATHSGDVTGSGSLTIADNAVTLAKMAGGTDGQIITYDASGDPVAVGPGTDGQVLTSTGAGSPPAFETISSSDTLSFRNLIINGDCQINQRHGIGGNVTGLTNGAADYGADRWQIKITNPSGGTWAFNHTDTSYEAGGFRRSVQLALTGTAQATSAASTMIYIRHTVEAKNAVRLAWGTGSAKQLTLSFWMNCNVAGDGQVNIQHTDGSKRVSGTYTYSSAGSWQKQTITFPASAEEINNDTGAAFRVEWVVCAGADAKTGSVQTSWATPAEGDRAAGQTINIATTVGHKFAITGVQLEEGATATEFERLDYNTNLMQCQRYYQQHVRCGASNAKSTSQVDFNPILYPDMRTAPTVGQTGVISMNGDNADKTQGSTGLNVYGSDTTSAFVRLENFSSLTAWRVYLMKFGNSNALTYSAEY